jgi:hypothetical protein
VELLRCTVANDERDYSGVNTGGKEKIGKFTLFFRIRVLPTMSHDR